jgi:hypothetical protein
MCSFEIAAAAAASGVSISTATEWVIQLHIEANEISRDMSESEINVTQTLFIFKGKTFLMKWAI